MISVILLSIVGGIVYLIWMIVTAFKKRWKKLGYQFASAVVYVGLLYVAGVLHDRYEEAQYFRGVFAVSGTLPTPTFSYDSERAFNGDGYSIQVFALPKSVRERFESFDEKALGALPQKPDYRSQWKTSPWRKTPMQSSENKYLDFALSNFGPAEVRYHQKAIRELVGKTGSYVAYFYFDHGDYPGNIDLFVVDLEGNRLYLINFNT
ncbi:MAG: hypothetical protein Q8M02_13935 [Candidatus Didemnitutus sp.]|nr:hypothetical protein [Candidatus Didemnitutus sp.]